MSSNTSLRPGRPSRGRFQRDGNSGGGGGGGGRGGYNNRDGNSGYRSGGGGGNNRSGGRGGGGYDSGPRRAPPPVGEQAPVPETLHNLEQEWNFWFTKNTNARGGRMDRKSYEKTLDNVGMLDKVEEFWQFLNNMNKPRALEHGSTLSFFHGNIKPSWEDKGNANGGEIRMELGKNNGSSNDIWERLLMAMVGEQLDSGSHVCGAVLSRRHRGDRVAVWHNDTDDTKVQALVARIKEVVFDGLPEKNTRQVQFDTRKHADSIKQNT